MADQSPGGVTPPEPPGTGVTPTPTPTPPPPDPPGDPGDGGTDDDVSRDAGVDDLRKALNSERRTRRDLARELKGLQDAEKARADATKTDIERATDRAEAAERRVSELERTTEAAKIAAEFQIPQWADELAADLDTRAMRAHAQKIRERLGGGSGMDGGVRGLGVPPAATSMDDMIRKGFGR